ncbi:UDP-glycosyltransferase 84B1 [Beta vulgaris subsp. vulgaris]|uniref:UDP-glycosyltransferase 84B1 n=1 Tax=Beta vulgaris subsp. vulgaris TaxID=3555 RepID=UPI002036AE1C|nr:UDP-glycosyltransferase 84B1 [Beta vulgaris subsp. vulgaris]
MAHTKEVHVLMVTLFYHGHINPMVHFAKLLASKGLHVTLATTNHAREKILNGLATRTNFIDYEFFDDGLDIELDRDSKLASLIEEYLPRDGAKNLSNLISTLEEKGKKFACIINNCFVPWVTNVATMHNISCAMLWVQSCATYAIFYHYHHNTQSYLASLNDPNYQANFDIPGLPLLNIEDLPTFILPSSPPHFLKVLMTTMNVLDQFQWIFGSSFCDLEESLVHSMAQFKAIHPIGPLVSPSMLSVEGAQEDEQESDICMDWLNKQGTSSVIYIALGSISVLSQSETEALAMALESDSNKRFLWVRKEGEKILGRKMGELPKEFLENTKDRGLIVPWCCQEKVLTHPSIKCFLTHCGWNSTLETITAGIPVIAYPDWTDQPTNAKLLVDVFKVGVRMSKSKDGQLGREEIERCLLEVTKGPKALAMKEQAIKLKVLAKKATMSGGSSNMNVDNFVNELSAKSV